MTRRLTILDDYQQVAMTSADWSPLMSRFEIEVITEHIADADTLVARLCDSEVVVAMRERTAFPESVLARLPELRLLISTGMKNAAIDVDAATARGITVSGTGGAGNAMPELTLGIILALTRHFAAEDASMRRGGWQHTIGPGISGKTLGVIGLGRLGVPVARLAQAFDMDVVAWSPHLTEARAAEHGVRAVSRVELFSQADIVTLHMPLSDESRGLIGPADFARMKPTSYFVNTSRGPIVDESALVSALRSGQIAGAGLDVYDIEPLPADHVLRTLPNTLLLPHIGYVTTDSYAVFYRDAIEDVLAYLDGAPIRTL